ncbi:hypothetical protein [Nonomuraea rubra]|uniref:Uncharacterized protein n=1 Tax=Nonomuraea rubra TaxID=46180 RepID=A0A7X0U102_9ACTN|nr:hypothetical protein [Nonomuraea rubra]MBB6551237.1 hypothetical protein [Nonomuraea rubra]
MSDSVAADTEGEASEAAAPPPFEPARMVPTRPDGWPDWLGRRPISSVDRDRILKDLSADQEELDAAKRRDGLRLAPLFSSVTIEGVGGQGDPRKVARLRAAINAACRVAAGDRRTSYHATDVRITIGIAGPDAHERIAVLRRQLPKMGGSRGWTITEDLN